MLEGIKKDFASMLSEVHRAYLVASQKKSADISLELLWLTKEVSNQPYNADIQLYIIARAIDNLQKNAEEYLNSFLTVIYTTLIQQKYEIAFIPYEDFALTYAAISDQKTVLLTKDERIESLQNQILPECFAFDIFSEYDDNFSKTVNTLNNYPGCLVSFQLIPTTYSPGELAIVDRMAMTLSTLYKGVHDQGLGTVGISIAEKQLETYQHYSKYKNGALFYFNIAVSGPAKSVDTIASRIFGQLKTGSEKTSNIALAEFSADEIQKDQNFYPLPWAINELSISQKRSQSGWTSEQMQPFFRLPFIITATEASEFFRLPVGTDKTSAGLSINESGKISRTYASNIINGGDISVGNLKASSKNDTIGFFLNDLTKHMLVVGTPGSGKTTFTVGMLDRLWKEHNIPFLVIEPAKTEYRALVQSIPELQIFTPGKNFISPFMLNPFIPPANVKLETYKSTLKTAFAAAVSMSTPLDKIFEESVNNCYSDFRSA